MALKGLHTKAQHEKCFIQIYVFYYTGVFVMRDFPRPDRDSNNYGKNRLEPILTLFAKVKTFP